MTSPLRPARLDWSQGTPFSPDFGDVYFSSSGGAEESRHVFLEQNDLPRRFRACRGADSFTIAETGFGTGLNWLTATTLWRQQSTGGWLHYISVEKHPLRKADIIRAHACWPEFNEIAAELHSLYPRLLPGFHRLVFPQWRMTLTLFLGDIQEFLDRVDARVDAWFLDGFAPDRNPDMWSASHFGKMADLSKPFASFATFTAAGHVKRGLQAAGFAVEKVAGYGRKREMLTGRLDEIPPATPTIFPWLHRPATSHDDECAVVIGAGVAGASIAARLALRGWKITILDSGDDIATGGSGNPAAIMYPKLGPADQIDNEFAQQSWLFMLAWLKSGKMPAGMWNPCGVLQLLTTHQQRNFSSVSDHPWLNELVYLQDADAASTTAGIKIDKDALWYPDAGWLDAKAYCRHLLNHSRIRVLTNTHVARLEQTPHGWDVFDPKGQLIAACPIVIAANGRYGADWKQTNFLPLVPVPGQISTVPPSMLSARLNTVICHDGYISPGLPNGQHCMGATFHPGVETIAETAEDHQANHLLQQAHLPELTNSLPSPTKWTGRASMRCQTPDHLPLVGPVADIEKFKQDYAGLRDGKTLAYPMLSTRPGLYVSLGHGSRGFSQSLLCAEILAAEICNEPSPVSRKILCALHPMRFAARDIKRNRI